MSLPQIVLYDAHNLKHMDSHDLMGLWDIFVRSRSLHQQAKWQNQKYQMIVKLKVSPAVSKLKEISFHYFPECFAISLSHTNTHTHTQLCITRHLIAVMFCVATSFWRRFICECVLSCVSVCMSIPRYSMSAHPVKACLTAATMDGRPSFSCQNGWHTGGRGLLSASVNYPRRQEHITVYYWIKLNLNYFMYQNKHNMVPPLLKWL